jgi:hypothetical protein
VNEETGVCRIACTDVSGNIHDFRVWVPIASGDDGKQGVLPTKHTLESAMDVELNDNCADDSDSSEVEAAASEAEEEEDHDLDGLVASLFD